MEPGAYAEALVDEAAGDPRMGRPPAHRHPRRTARRSRVLSVSRGLQQVAADEGALAIVVGPSHRGRVGRIVPGSVGTRLLHGAPCPVAVAPNGFWSEGHAPIRRIGVGYVGPPEGEEALHAAVGLAAATGASVRALGVVEPAVATAAVPLGLGYVEREECTRADLAEGLRHATRPRRAVGRDRR